MKSHDSNLDGHSDNIHHVTAAPVNNVVSMHDLVIKKPSVMKHMIDDDDDCNDNMLHDNMLHDNMLRDNMLRDNMLHDNMLHDNMLRDNMLHDNMLRDNMLPMILNDLEKKIGDLMMHLPQILDKCTPKVLQTLGKIHKLIRSTDGNVTKLKSVEPILTKEFNDLNKILIGINKNDVTCLENELHMNLTTKMCDHLNKTNVNELRNHVNTLEYVNEMLKSQKQNFRQLRDLFVTRMRDLVNTCDIHDPVKRELQLRSISTISEILHNLGYIFQDDTMLAQNRML